MASELGSSIYILDTHALYWYWTEPTRLGADANVAFQSLEAREALGLVPLIVIAELHYLTSKLGKALSVEDILRLVDRASSLRLEPLARRHLLAFGQLQGVAEMHDRLIGAVALVHDSPIISRDSALRDHPMVRVVW